MLEFLTGKTTDRKFRLLACACCRRIWHLLTDGPSRHAVEVAERYADGSANGHELSSARELASAAYSDGGDAFYGLRTDIQRPHSTAPHGAAIHVADPELWSIAHTLSSAAHGVFHNVQPFTEAEVLVAINPERVAQAVLIREIFGNPFCLVAVNPLWFTSTVLELARQMYERRDFYPMPILADALQDTGCDSDDILLHCRQPGEHVRGCWVVDLLQGKK
jgi:hypothetical protein